MSNCLLLSSTWLLFRKNQNMHELVCSSFFNVMISFATALQFVEQYFTPQPKKDLKGIRSKHQYPQCTQTYIHQMGFWSCHLVYLSTHLLENERVIILDIICEIFRFISFNYSISLVEE